MASFEVTRSALATVADELTQSTSSFRSIMDETTSLVNNISTVWDSDAHTEFDNKYKKLEANLHEFDTVMTRYAEFLRETSSNYDTTDQNVQEETQVLNSESLFGR